MLSPSSRKYATKHTNSSSTIRILRDTFARFGLPVTIVSDNGPQFRSNEMEQFAKNNGVQHKFTAPYHRATNRQAERFVQMHKKRLRLRQKSAEFMFKRPIFTRLELMKRNITTEMNEKSTADHVKVQ
jgi:transposase InsO family protein